MRYLATYTYPNGTTEQQVIPVPDRIPVPGSGEWELESDDYAKSLARTAVELWVIEETRIDIQPLEARESQDA